jgi:leucyl-tRNA---protein transferase
VRADEIKVFVSLEHPCGYFSDRVARNLVLDPHAHPQGGIYARAMPQGFRRAGGHIYKPYCSACQACVASRIVIADFAPTRAQKRCALRNIDLRISIRAAGIDAETFALYRRYLQSRHPGGGMDQADESDFQSFLFARWSDSQFVEFRLHDRLVAVAVTDFVRGALSAVYTFYDPELRARSLGTYAVLSQIALAKSTCTPYLYLGYWIANHPKMDYKRRFSGTEIFQDGRWQALTSIER